jgi:RHS repeat-associated protein
LRTEAPKTRHLELQRFSEIGLSLISVVCAWNFCPNVTVTMATTTAYIAGTSQVLTVTDPASVAQATYAYDLAGRIKSIQDALGKFTYFEYNDRNQKLREWGQATYPVEYYYDPSGRQTAMRTFAKNSKGIVSGSEIDFTSSTWPTAAGTDLNDTATAPAKGDRTRWVYQTGTGLLSSKIDADGHAITYSYTQAGRVYQKTNARAQVTTYTYSSSTGELTDETYSDGTPSIYYTYNRLSGLSGVTDDAGTRAFTYNLSGTLELQREDFTAGAFVDQRLTYGYDTSTTGALGRLKEFDFGTNTNPTGKQVTTYSYQADGRLWSVLWNGYIFTYTYAANSHLISSTACLNYLDTRTYNTAHDWIASRSTTISGLPKAAFAYTPDVMGRIISTVKTGEMYSPYGNGSQGLSTEYGYDDRSQLKGEQTKVGTTSTLLPGRDNGTAATPGFVYDNIGNRVSTSHNSQSATYTVNNLNQYTNRTVPGYFDVQGYSSAGTVTVNNNGNPPTDTAARSGQYFFDAYPLTNTTAAVKATLNITAGGSPVTLSAFLAPSNFTNTYDADGNLTDDGRWSYHYNIKNELTSIQTSAPAVAAGVPNVAYFYYYDYLGRRIIKSYYTLVSGNLTIQSQERYIYNGWNLVAVLDVFNNVSKSYIWGLDLSGTMGGAGGVGGLLLVADSGQLYFPAYDAMGNVCGMIKYSDGSMAAAYEYDAFGKVLRESGAYAASNPFQYSTKFTDVETGLVYYGLRYYSPSLGRFINRDPIEESGGLNLYGFCANNGVNRWDLLGLTLKDEMITLDPFVVNGTSGSDPSGPDANFPEYWWRYVPLGNPFWSNPSFYGGGGSGGGGPSSTPPQTPDGPKTPDAPAVPDGPQTPNNPTAPNNTAGSSPGQLIADTAAGMGLPTLPKTPAMGSLPVTSPASVAARDVLGGIPVPSVRTPTISTFTKGAPVSSGNLGGVVGRYAPAVGVGFIAWDVATSNDPGRALAVNWFGTLGASFGSTVGTFLGMPLTGGAVGSYFGSMSGGIIFDGDANRALDQQRNPYRRDPGGGW